MSAFRLKRRNVIVCCALVALAAAIWGWDRLLGNTFFSFRARVVSVGGSPIAGAAVTIKVISYNLLQIPVPWGTVRGTTRAISMTTDSRGECAVHAVHGSWIGVADIQKSGFGEWYNNGTPTSFVFGGSGSDRTATGAMPTYALVPLGPSAGNIKGSVTVRPRRDGVPVLADLASGSGIKPSPRVAPLSVAVVGPENGRVRPPERFEWSVSVSGEFLEFRETADIAPQRAPSDGYTPTFQLVATPSQRDWSQPDPGWPTKFERRFYARSRDGHFRAWCEITASPTSLGIEDTAEVTLKCVYNTTGSPDLFAPQRR
jgi:hypothetical protein